MNLSENSRITDQAQSLVPAFRNQVTTFYLKLSVNGKSTSCQENYIRQISKLVLHYRRSPLDCSARELEAYMAGLRREETSLSSFKHLVYGLRQFYRIFGRGDMQPVLPTIPHSKHLPVVFSQHEVKQILHATPKLKHRILLAVIYDGGLRISEAIALHVTDIDQHRRMLHVRKGKGNKDRYVPISPLVCRGLQQYLVDEKPTGLLFEGKYKGKPMSQGGVRLILRNALHRCGIKKDACVHGLRHSYATHLLEMGIDLVTLQQQMGHARIEQTMEYTHLVRVSAKTGFSPMEKLYGKKEG